MKKIHNLFRRKNEVSLKLFEYKTESGAFDYEKYKETQIAGNKRKIDQCWVTEDEIIFLSNLILDYVDTPLFGICHGTRRGLEQKWFSKELGCEVIGTEISDTAKNFPNTIQWDFHEPIENWIGKADFVYSNSLDHAYNPKKALSNWINSLQNDGVCIIEHTQNHTPKAVSPLDPFGIKLEYFPFKVLEWSEGQYSVREIINSPFKKEIGGQVNYIVIKKNQ